MKKITPRDGQQMPAIDLIAYNAEENRKHCLALKRAARARDAQALIDMLGHSGIPERFKTRTFDTYQATTPGQQKALDACMQYAEQFKDRNAEGLGLLLLGSPGTGKTHLACAVCKEVIGQGYTALFTSTLGALQSIKETYRRDSELSEREAIRKFVEPDLLVLDEVGVQHCTTAEEVLLTDLVNQRYEQNKPIIILGNHTPKELASFLGERIVDRLREVSRLVDCKWESYRGRAR